jgi:hypothetical protein
VNIDEHVLRLAIVIGILSLAIALGWLGRVLGLAIDEDMRRMRDDD